MSTSSFQTSNKRVLSISLRLRVHYWSWASIEYRSSLSIFNSTSSFRPHLRLFVCCISSAPSLNMSSMELSIPCRLQSQLQKSRVKAYTTSTSSTYIRLPFCSTPNQKLGIMNSPTRKICQASLVENNGSPTTSAGNTFDCTGRTGEVKRVTKETNVHVKINLDGTGIADSSSAIPFLDHMLDQLASHGLFDVHVRATGDTHIDDHHTNEDVSLSIGTALLQALSDQKGINRFGDFTAPLDEALVHVSLDLSGRPYLGYDLQIPTERVGTYDTQLVEHFFQSLVNTSGMTLHIRQLAGKNSHHIIEATFKAFARALRQATEYDHRRAGTIPSSKGVLSRA